MLKRLLFAVFVLGLVFSLTGTAISGIGQKPADALQPIPTFNPNAQHYNSDISDARPASPTWRPATLDVQQLPDLGPVPSPPSTYFCDYILYHSGNDAWIWGIPSSSTRSAFAVRFTVEPLMECTLKVGWALVYGGAMTGTPEVSMSLHDDDGFGLPGNKLDEVIFTNAQLPASVGWLAADWPGPSGDFSDDWVFSDDEDYHIVYAVLGGPTDLYHIISDDMDSEHTGENRNEIYVESDASWYTMEDFYGPGADYGFWIESESCCYELPYTDCYSITHAGGPGYFWRAPHSVYNEDGWAMRFTVEGVETLQSVDIPIYSITDVVGDPDEFGNNAVTVTIFADDGTGYPGAVVAAKTLAAGTYPAFPSYTNVDFSADDIVFQAEDFFVSFTSDGQGSLGDGSNEATLSDDGSTATGRAYVLDVGSSTWYTMLDWWGGEYDFLYYANLCKDPFTDCRWNSHYVGVIYYWNLPDAYGDYQQAVKFTAVGEDCQVKNVAWCLYNFGEFGVDASYTYDSKVSVYTDAAGLPGTELASIILTPADYNMFPSFTEVDFTSQAVSVPDVYWVAIESFAPTADEGIATMSDWGGSGINNTSAEGWGTGWAILGPNWGGPADAQILAESYHCCIPYPRRDCGPGGEDWATAQHDQQRTGASFNAFGDAQCDLTALWGYQHPTERVFDCGPAIVGDKIVCAFEYEVKVFDLATGAELYTVIPGAASSIIRHVPFVTPVAGVTGLVMYLGGDDQQSVTAYDFATGTVIWINEPTGPSDVYGITRYPSFILLNDGVDDILYWGTENGNILAVYAATGVLYAGWVDNPVALTQTVRKSGSTDGTSLFYNSAATGSEGDVYSIDALTGYINWQLSDSGGLQANTVFPQDLEDPEDPGQIGEGFPGGNSYENGVVYVNSDIAVPWHPGDGVMYAIDASDGSIIWAAPSTGARAATGSGTPVIDMNRIYYAGESTWGSPPVSRVAAFNKYSGSSAWQFESVEYNNYWGDAALSCEQGAEYDLLFVAGHHGFISALNSSNGEEVFRRRVQMGAYPAAVGLSFAIAPGYLAMTDFYGSLYVLSTTSKVDRPRLELQTYQAAVPVEFGNLTTLEVSIPGVFVNTGCSYLTFGQIETNETSSAAYIPAFSASNVRDDVMDRASSISDKLTDGFSTKALIHMPEADIDDSFMTRDRSEQLLNAGADVGVGFLQYGTYTEAIVSPLDGAILAAGDTADLVIDVNQSMVLRGPQDFYAVIPTDDPDFFLHNVPGIATGMVPEIHVTIVGGCLSDSVHMPVGMGGANTQIVTNTGRLGLGDWTPHALEIDGDNSFYQGGFIYANDVHNVALNCHAWYGQGESFSWHSMQPDPTWCDDMCAIALVEDVPLSCLGGYSDDGETYTPIMGNFVCATYLDSMQDFSLGGTVEWEWSNFGAGFDNDLTIGLIVNSRTVAAVDFAPLANITVDIMEITERNGDSVKNWRFGAFVDYDIGNDRAQIDREGSVAFQSSGGVGDKQWGMMKFPFGCGINPNVDFVPMINAVSGHGGEMFYDQYSPPYLDSAWLWMGRPAGLYSQNINTDEEFHCTFATHDFAGDETYEIAIAQFSLQGTDGTSAEAVALAKLANKWLGFSRGDVDNVGSPPNLADIIYLANYVNGKGPGPVPFMHLGDVNCDDVIDMADVLYLIAWYFDDGLCPCGDWCF